MAVYHDNPAQSGHALIEVASGSINNQAGGFLPEVR